MLGARTRRRPDARFGPALAGAGAALALVGAFIWAVGYLAHDFGISFDSGDGEGTTSVHGEGRRFLGFGVFLALALAGYAVLVLRRHGPLATAGTVASAFGVPLALGFAFLDIAGAVRSGAFPVNVDAVYLISIGVWLATYLGVPGARGRAVYLAASALALPSYIAIKASGDGAFRVGFSAVSGGLGGGGAPDTHRGTVATLTLVFGLVYYALAALLDRTDRGGVAVALLFPAFVTTASGISLAATDFGQLGTGAALTVIGALVALYGGRFGRRFTTWSGATSVVVGVVVLVTKLGTDHYTAVGLILVGIGIVVAVAAHFAHLALREAPDVAEEPAPAR